MRFGTSLTCLKNSNLFKFIRSSVGPIDREVNSIQRKDKIAQFRLTFTTLSLAWTSIAAEIALHGVPWGSINTPCKLGLLR